MIKAEWYTNDFMSQTPADYPLFTSELLVYSAKQKREWLVLSLNEDSVKANK